MRDEPRTRNRTGRRLAAGAVLIAACAAAAAVIVLGQEKPPERGAGLAGSAGTPFVVTRAPETTAARLILDCTVPGIEDETSLKHLASVLYDDHRGGDFEQVLIRYRLALPPGNTGTKDKPELKAIAVLSKNATTFGITR